VEPITVEELRVDFNPQTCNRAKAVARARALLRDHGAFVAAGLIAPSELEPIHADIESLIQLKRKQVGLAGACLVDISSRFDDGFLEMCRINRSYGGSIYDACRRLMPVHHMATHPEFQSLSKALMNTETLIASTLNAVRIDHPSEDKYLFLWHQDYPYIQDSEDALVYWVPLHDVNEENGWLRLALGSHKQGVHPVKVVDPGNKNRNGARSIELADLSLPDQFQQVCVPVQAGELLVFSTLLLHCSQPNRSRNARWTLQIRHGNFENATAVARNWPGGLIENVPFEESHPEYVANLTELRKAA